MASSAKRKTTMAKLNRERRLLEKRAEKQARKDARTRAAAAEAELGPAEAELGPAADEEAVGDDALAAQAPAPDATR
jgi:hypothetical protein